METAVAGAKAGWVLDRYAGKTAELKASSPEWRIGAGIRLDEPLESRLQSAPIRLDGRYVWSTYVESKGALGLILQVGAADLEDDDEIWFLTPNGPAHGPYRKQYMVLQSPAMRGERGYVLLASADLSHGPVTLDGVSHLFRHPFRPSPDDMPPCVIDVRCLLDPGSGWDLPPGVSRSELASISRNIVYIRYTLPDDLETSKGTGIFTWGLGGVIPLVLTTSHTFDVSDPDAIFLDDQLLPVNLYFDFTNVTCAGADGDWETSPRALGAHVLRYSHSRAEAVPGYGEPPSGGDWMLLDIEGSFHYGDVNLSSRVGLNMYDGCLSLEAPWPDFAYTFNHSGPSVQSFASGQIMGPSPQPRVSPPYSSLKTNLLPLYNFPWGTVLGGSSGGPFWIRPDNTPRVVGMILGIQGWQGVPYDECDLNSFFVETLDVERSVRPFVPFFPPANPDPDCPGPVSDVSPILIAEHYDSLTRFNFCGYRAYGHSFTCREVGSLESAVEECEQFYPFPDPEDDRLLGWQVKARIFHSPPWEDEPLFFTTWWNGDDWEGGWTDHCEHRPEYPEDVWWCNAPFARPGLNRMLVITVENGYGAPSRADDVYMCFDPSEPAGIGENDVRIHSASVSPNPGLVGGEVVYTVTVRNSWDFVPLEGWADVTLTAEIPVGLSCLGGEVTPHDGCPNSSGVACTCECVGPVIRCVVGTLDNNFDTAFINLRFEPIEPGEYDLTLNAQADTGDPNPDNNSTTVDLVVRNPSTVAGRITRGQTALPGATVTAEYCYGGPGFPAEVLPGVSDANGDYTLTVLNVPASGENYRQRIVRPGYVTVVSGCFNVQPRTTVGPRDFMLQIDPGLSAAIGGTVTNSQGGPLSGVAMSAAYFYSGPPDHPIDYLPATTNAQGQFTVTLIDVPATGENYKVIGQKLGYQTRQSGRLNLQRGQALTGVSLQMPTCPAPTLLSPANGAQVGAGSTFMWELNACLPTRWQLPISGGDPPATRNINLPPAPSSYALSGTELGFVWGPAYTWKVRACWTSNCSSAGAWSVSRTFQWSGSDTQALAPTATDSRGSLEKAP